MFKRNRYPLTALAALAILATAVSVATASSTTIRVGSATGAPYSGGVVATNVGNIVTTHSLGTTTCTSLTQEGTTDSDGNPVTISTAGYGPACSNSDGTTTTVTAQSLPWTGSVVAATNKAWDATMTLSYIKLKSVRSDGLTCYYESSNGVSEIYNGNNPNRPNTSNNEAQIHMNAETMTRASGSGFLCPSTTSTTGVLQLKTTGGSSLFATH